MAKSHTQIKCPIAGDRPAKQHQPVHGHQKGSLSGFRATWRSAWGRGQGYRKRARDRASESIEPCPDLWRLENEEEREQSIREVGS